MIIIETEVVHLFLFGIVRYLYMGQQHPFLSLLWICRPISRVREREKENPGLS